MSRVIVGVVLLAGRLIAGSPGERKTAHLGLFIWDGDWYRKIATAGYKSVTPGCDAAGGYMYLCRNIRFFPLYPLLGRWLGTLLAGRTDIALLLLSSIPALGVGALAHHVCLTEKGDPDLARRAAKLIALAPPAFVLVLAYSEALAIAVAMLTLLAARRGRWHLAIAAGLVAGLFRPVGLLLVVPLAWEAFRSTEGRRTRVVRMAAVGAPLAGTALFLLWVRIRFGDALLPYRVQEIPGLRGHFVNPIVVVGEAVVRVATGRIGRQGHELTVLVLVALVVACWRHWPAAYALFATVSVASALAAQYLGSLERYGYDAFPLVLTVAALCSSRRSERALVVISGAAMGVFALFALLGGFIP